MAVTKSSPSDPHGKPSGKDSHDQHADEEDLVRTPLWLPFLGLGLLMAGALASYLWVYPGTMSTSTAGDGGDGGDGSAEAAAPAPANAPPAPAPAPAH